MAATKHEVNTLEAQAVRKILKPSRVRNGIPGWFRRALLKAFPTVKGDGSTVVNGVKRNLKLSWLDNFGSTEWGGQTAFVSEPSHLTLEELQSVAALTQTIGCAYAISANSFHYPGMNFRILIFQRATNSAP